MSVNSHYVHNAGLVKFGQRAVTWNVACESYNAFWGRNVSARI